MQQDINQNRDAVSATTFPQSQDRASEIAAQRDREESLAIEYLGNEPFTPSVPRASGMIDLNSTNAIAVDAALCDHPDTVVLVTNLNGLNPFYLDHLVETGRTVVTPYHFAASDRSPQPAGYSPATAFISAAAIAALVFLTSASIVVMPAIEIFFRRQLFT
ncbi:MAG: hypothetical protein JSS49_08355 [Planctomycetes bacterium]|nr:hypothetical protein [Planctomycetota bacterium]